jgi:SAM-dependent methyltransferase
MTLNVSGGIYPGHENLLLMMHARNYNTYLNDLIKTAAPRGGHILDFGAGVGALAESGKLWADRLTCVEMDLVQLGILRSKGFTAIPSLESVPDGSIDFIYCINVLEHIKDDLDVLLNLRQKIVNGGTLLLYVPAFRFLFSQMDVAVGHYRRYEKADLASLLKTAGFEVDKIRFVDFLGVFATLAYKAVGQKDGGINLNALKFYDKFLFPLSRNLDKLFDSLVGKNLLVIAKKNG